MKTIKLLPLLLLFILSSCSSVTVYSDFDKKVDFSPYKTYAFHQAEIDKVQISQLDKNRILNAIDAELTKKGMTKSENPDLLIHFFTKEPERVGVNQYSNGWSYGWGYGLDSYYWGEQFYMNTSTEGTLYIDLIDTKKKELIWQGEGVGHLTRNRSKKEARINEFVSKILMQYPPVKK